MAELNYLALLVKTLVNRDNRGRKSPTTVEAILVFWFKKTMLGSFDYFPVDLSSHTPLQFLGSEKTVELLYDCEHDFSEMIIIFLQY